MSTVFINELHYDNVLFDQGEGFEIAGPAGTDLNGWKVELYEGAKGKVYKVLKLTGVLKDQQNGYGTLFFSVSLFNAGTSNGDGFALINPSGTIIQFLSYGGVFTASEGTCKGLRSTLLPVSENNLTPVGYSLQLIGIGAVYEDFSWVGPVPKSYGKPNKNQTFAPWRKEGVVIGPILHFKSSNSDGHYNISIVLAFKPSESLPLDKLELSVKPEPKSPPKKQTLLQKGEHHVLRYDLTIQQTDNEQTVTYQFSGDQEYSFRVPGLNQPPRFAYVSCAAAESELDLRSDNLWLHMKTIEPNHLLIHGGDQVYTDLPHPFIWTMIPRFAGYVATGLKTLFDTSKPFTPELDVDVDDFYFHMYRRFWSQQSVRHILASTPSIMMWDDHEIFDGYGSFYDEVQFSDTFKGVFKIAQKYFSVFQLGSTLESPSSTTIPNQDALSQEYYLNKVAILSLDMRTERNRNQILSPKSWEAVQTSLNNLLNSDIHHLFVLSGVPVLYDNFELVSQLIAGHNFDIEDDLTDHWAHPTHVKELELFVTKLFDFAATKKIRVSILSGDVHAGCMAVIVDDNRAKQPDHDNSCVINNLTSSAIGSMSLPRVFASLLDTQITLTPFKYCVGQNIHAGLHKFKFGLTSLTPPTYHLASRNFLTMKFEQDHSLTATWHVEGRPMIGVPGKVSTVTEKILPYTVGKTNDVSY
eukprot:TRINITY_DN1749_c0_g1_i4.p1 TRINITY_DN1749_c0_g1~~TRINITY_DN1749_c0_g1_i4.p1  ORF type:complete len:695 (+),score=137.31 TRINITY_DN1749_c0_g1_i4:55-2139(+)